jgi:TatD DNase family protein
VIDSHCHLADEAFVADADAVIDRARAAGLTHALCVVEAGNEAEEQRAARLVSSWPQLRSAVGVHPHMAGRFAGRCDEVVDTVRRQINRTTSARAVGEIGLDYHYDLSPRGVQREVFAAQVRLAAELGLPVVIHSREADNDTITILREEGRASVRGVMHCFTGDDAMARRSLELDFYLSFAGIVTFPKAARLRGTAGLVPADRLLIETDAPYLAPVPNRGKRNEPAWVLGVLQTLAEVRRIPTPELDVQVTENFIRLFHP